MSNTVQHNEILTAISGFAQNVQEQFEEVKDRLTSVEYHLSNIEGRVTGVETRLTTVESTMVTKSYLDDKLADLRGDLVVLVRKEDTKLEKVVDILEEKEVFTTSEAQEVMAMEPFSKLQLKK